MNFNIILRHIFPENFIEFPRAIQRIWRNSLSILANFHQFSSNFWISWHYLVPKKLIMSAFFHFQHTLNRCFNNWIKLYWYYISSSWNIKGYEGIQIDPHSGKTTLKRSSLIRVNHISSLSQIGQWLDCVHRKHKVLGSNPIPLRPTFFMESQKP